jgi:hypothetical protein
MTLTQPLDLNYWLVTTFSGTAEIFTIVAILAITIFCAKMRIPTGGYIALISLFTIIFMSVYGLHYIFIAIIIIGGAIVYRVIKRIPE